MSGLARDGGRSVNDRDRHTAIAGKPAPTMDLRPFNNGFQARPIDANLAWVCSARTAADNSTSSPLLPALTKIVGNGCAVLSIKVRKRFFCPSGLIPPNR